MRRRGEDEFTDGASLAPIDEIRASADQELVVGIPAEILRAGLVIVDTPGFGIGDDQTWLLNSFVAAADVVLYVVRASQLGSLQDSEMLELVRRYTAAELLTVLNLDQDLGEDDRFLRFAAAWLAQGADESSQPVDRLTNAGVVLFGISGLTGAAPPNVIGIERLLDRLDISLAEKVQPRRSEIVLRSLAHLSAALREQLRVRQAAAVQLREAVANKDGDIATFHTSRVRDLVNSIDGAFRYSGESVQRDLESGLACLLREVEGRLNNVILHEELSGILVFPDARKRAVDKLVERCAKEASTAFRQWSNAEVATIIGPAMESLQDRLAVIVGDFQNKLLEINQPIELSSFSRGESVTDAFVSAALMVGDSSLASLSSRMTKGGINPIGIAVGTLVGTMLFVPFGAAVGAIVGSTFGGEARLRALVRQEAVPFILNKTNEAGLAIVARTLKAIADFSADLKAEMLDRLQDELRSIKELSNDVRQRVHEAATTLERLGKVQFEMDAVANAIGDASIRADNLGL